MQSTDGIMLEAPSEPTTGGGDGGTKQSVQELKVYEGATIRLAVTAAEACQGVGGHLSADPAATGDESTRYAPAAELFFTAGTLSQPEEDLVLHVHSARNPTDGARHRYRVNLGPRRNLAGVDVLLTKHGVEVAWRSSSRVEDAKPRTFDLRTCLPVGGAEGFFAGAPDRFYFVRNGLLEPRAGCGGAGYEGLAAIVEISYGESGGGEGEEGVEVGGPGNTGPGGG